MAVPKSALQEFVTLLVMMLPEARDYYDRLYQQKTGTTGKPLYDMQRGKSRQPSNSTLKIISELTGQPVDLFRQAADGERVTPKRLVSLRALSRVEEDTAPTRDASSGEIVSIIRLNLSLPMGPGATVDEYVEEEPLEFDLAYLRGFTRTPPHRLRLAAGAGDSMFPTLVSNDLVWIDTTQNQLLHSDRIYAASINGGAAIKRLRPVAGGKRVLVVSDNKTVEPYEVDASEVVIWGRVIRYARDL